MKKVILVILIFISPYIAKSQGYQSIFGNDSTRWNIVHGIIDGAITDIYTTKTGFDSTLNGLNYKIVFDNGYFGGNHFSGLIREDTATGKAWYYSFNTHLERTIMDLSLQQNDTFRIYNYWNDSMAVMVDTVYYSGGLKHIQFDYELYGNQGPIPFEFIESIGANAGITFHDDGFIYNDDQLLCKYNDGVQVYTNTSFNGNCFIVLSGIDELQKVESTFIFPNPVRRNNLLHLKNDGDEIQSVSLFDLLGNRISQTNNKQIKIEQAPGIYLIEIITTSGLVRNSKLVVTD